MVLEKLGDSLKNTLGKIAKAVFVDEKLVNELVKEIQRALLQSDVNVKLVFELSNKIKERALKQEPPSGLTKKEYLINIVYEELANFLGGEGHKIEITKKPFKIMLCGLFGNGKTTTAAKLAKFFQKRGNKVALIQTDTWRPAAYDQLQQLGTQIHVDVFGIKQEKDPEKIYKTFEKELNKYSVVIIDTAGRDALSNDLIKELDNINKLVQPDETLLVMSADVGQAAEKQAQAFHETCSVTGVIITKLDGTAKGGGALIACSVTGAPVKFIGVGEKVDAFEEFKPKNFVGRLLGMGDLETLLEKAKEAVTEEEAQDMSKKFLSGKFNLLDLYSQMETMGKMGSLSKLMEMIPGMSQLQLPKDMINVQEGKLQKWKYILNSCTKEELEDPDIIDAPRIKRIAVGSGTHEKDMRELLKQYKQAKKMTKMFGGAGSPKAMEKMMKRMGGQIPGLGNVKLK
ncbi:signal recognition particle protein [Candidatus Woesearchaeota archaeon CG10_big_fil_rev_8_21_14_0_10_34_8]|nr:MAG: signal recognition particle protein [Candidatus Woesearchaeota archaeon CG10_big_fil_rev_8_21_14_0_10_34_8]